MATNKEIYKVHLESVPTVLRETIDELQTIIINLAMSGELAVVNDKFEEDDSLSFKYEDFRKLTDYNVNLLYEVYDFLETKRNELMNVNGLAEEAELEF